jgi:hypothetical protein
MKITIPLANLVAVELQSMSPGALFYTIRDDHEVGGLCMSLIDLGGVKQFVTLDGVKSFRLHAVDVAAARRHVIPFPVDVLHVKFDSEQPSGGEYYLPGSLLLSEAGPLLNVQRDGMAGQTRMFGARLTDGALTTDSPDYFASVKNWQLVARAPSGKETVLLVVGDAS